MKEIPEREKSKEKTFNPTRVMMLHWRVIVFIKVVSKWLEWWDQARESIT